MLLALFVMTTAGVAQDGGTNNPKKPKNAKPAAVDCSRVDDATITSKVKQRLANTASLKDVPIVVETREGAVTLSGTIKSGGLKGVATMQTRRVDCVKSVNNQLTVEQGRKNTRKDSGADR
jgi:osmotically-inducible protein OsmY